MGAGAAHLQRRRAARADDDGAGAAAGAGARGDDLSGHGDVLLDPQHHPQHLFRRARRVDGLCRAAGTEIPDAAARLRGGAADGRRQPGRDRGPGAAHPHRRALFPGAARRPRRAYALAAVDRDRLYAPLRVAQGHGPPAGRPAAAVGRLAQPGGGAGDLWPLRRARLCADVPPPPPPRGRFPEPAARLCRPLCRALGDTEPAGAGRAAAAARRPGDGDDAVAGLARHIRRGAGWPFCGVLPRRDRRHRRLYRRARHRAAGRAALSHLPGRVQSRLLRRRTVALLRPPPAPDPRRDGLDAEHPLARLHAPHLLPGSGGGRAERPAGLSAAPADDAADHPPARAHRLSLDQPGDVAPAVAHRRRRAGAGGMARRGDGDSSPPRRAGQPAHLRRRQRHRLHPTPVGLAAHELHGRAAVAHRPEHGRGRGNCGRWMGLVP